MYRTTYRRLTFILCALALSACSEEPKQKTVFALDRGEAIVLSFSSETPRVVSFGFLAGSASQEAAKRCPQYSTDGADSVQICGGLRDMLASGGAVTGIKSHFGGSAKFYPVNGKIKVELENLAQRPMEFNVTVDELKT